MIRRSGENIAAAEVEAALRSHPKILEAAVIPVPDDLRGEEVKAYIQLKDGSRAPTCCRTRSSRSAGRGSRPTKRRDTSSIAGSSS